MTSSSASMINIADYQAVGLRRNRFIRYPGTINGLEFRIEDIEESEVILLDHSAQVTVDDAKNSRITIGPVDGSCFIRNCENCIIRVACRQFRVRDCKNCDIYLYCGTKSPVIESSYALRFHCWNIAYPHQKEHFAAAHLDPSINYWNVIFDFTADDRSLPRPHYAIVDKPHKIIDMPLIDSGGNNLGVCECAVTQAPSLTLPKVEEKEEVDNDHTTEISFSYDQVRTGGSLTRDDMPMSSNIHAMPLIAPPPRHVTSSSLSSASSTPPYTTPAPTRSQSFSVDGMISSSPLPIPLQPSGTMRSLSGSGTVTPSLPSPRSSLSISSGSGGHHHSGSGIASRSGSMDWPQPTISVTTIGIGHMSHTNTPCGGSNSSGLISPAPSLSRSASFDVNDELVTGQPLSLRQRTLSELSDISLPSLSMTSPLHMNMMHDGTHSPVPLSSSSTPSASNTPLHHSGYGNRSPLPTPSQSPLPQSPSVSPPKPRRRVHIPLSTSPSPTLLTPPATPNDHNSALPPAVGSVGASPLYSGLTSMAGSPFDSLAPSPAPSPSGGTTPALPPAALPGHTIPVKRTSAVIGAQSTAVAAAAVLSRMTMQHQSSSSSSSSLTSLSSRAHHVVVSSSPMSGNVSPIIPYASGPPSGTGSPDTSSPLSPMSPDDQQSSSSPQTVSPRHQSFSDATNATHTSVSVTMNVSNTSGVNISMAMAAPQPYERTPRPTERRLHDGEHTLSVPRIVIPTSHSPSLPSPGLTSSYSHAINNMIPQQPIIVPSSSLPLPIPSAASSSSTGRLSPLPPAAAAATTPIVSSPPPQLSSSSTTGTNPSPSTSVSVAPLVVSSSSNTTAWTPDELVGLSPEAAYALKRERIAARRQAQASQPPLPPSSSS